MKDDERAAWLCPACVSISPQRRNNHGTNDDETEVEQLLNRTLHSTQIDDHLVPTTIWAQLKNISEQLELLKPLLALPTQVQIIQTDVKELTSTIAKQRVELKEATDRITYLENENATLNDILDRVYTEQQDNAQYQRRNNMIITGLPCTDGREDENTTVNHVKTLLGHLDVKIEPWDIVTSHRLPKKLTKDGKPSLEPPAIIVKFHNGNTKKEAIAASIAKKPVASLFGGPSTSRLYLNDHLTRENERLLGNARYRLCKTAPDGKKYHSIRFRDGKIIAKKTEQSRPTRIRNYMDIDRLEVPEVHRQSSQGKDHGRTEQIHPRQNQVNK
jgi:hypothetical protein